MKKLMILLCSFAAGVAMAEEYGDLLPEAARDWPRQFLESQNRPSALADENVYIVTNDVVFSGEAGESALRVAENASVCILICEGASLTCHGGNGLPATDGGDGVVPAFSNETVTAYKSDAWDFTYQMPRFALAVAGDGGAGGQGGGAGIEVPSGSTLEICGSGRLEAIGGAGGAGSAGGTGTNGLFHTWTAFRNGAGKLPVPQQTFSTNNLPGGVMGTHLPDGYVYTRMDWSERDAQPASGAGGGGGGGGGGAGIGSRGADGGAGGCGGAVTNLWLNGGPRAEIVSFLDDQGKAVPRLCGESGSSGVAAPECGTVTVSGGILLTVGGGAGGSAAEVDPVSLERTVVPFAYYEDAVGYRTAELTLYMNAGQSGGRGGSGGYGSDYGCGGSGGGGGAGGDSGSVSGDNHASEMPESLCGTNGLDVATAVPKWSVSYLDYDADTGTFTNAVRECTLVTSATRVLDNGWYAVQGTVTIPAGTNLSVVGTAHLILCDGATLTIPSPDKYYAAVNVSVVSSLVIYGQTDGTGALVAQGGGYGAGIGGGFEGAGGTVTINGGAVTAKGGGFSAGIGGGWVGTGGTVTINGGTVTAFGFSGASGIGCGYGASGGRVTINGGTVTASGFGGGPGIGDKNHKDGSMVTINGGTVTASSDQGSGVSGDTVEIDGGAINANSMLGGIRIRGGVFKNAPQSEWLAQYYKVFENPDETTKVEYPYAVMEDFIPYLDWDPVSRKMTNAIVRASAWIEVTDATRTLENGGWYVVTNNVVFPDGGYLSVNGSARLILCDGASLTIQNPGYNNAAVKVPEDASLVICGQIAGTGTLTAKGGMHSAGIGGGFRVSCGVITINGGTVTAMGGYVAAGIGGGSYGSGGTVTINGGAVTAVGNNSGSDIGPSDEKFGGTVTISGGIFARPLKGEWIADGYAIGANADSATSAAYPHAVMPAAFTVTISDNPHSTVQWTYGDGTVVTPVTGTSFKLGTGMTGVCVIFTPEHGYCFTVEGETGVRPLASPVIGDCAVEAPAVEEIPCEVTFAVGAGIRRAAYACGGVTNELVEEETALVVRLGTRIELIVEELPRHYPFAGERTFTVEQETMRVEIFASPIPKGMEGNPFQIGADVFASTNAAGVMTITGTGAMSNFVSATDVPWVPATVKKVTVDASVTSIGANAWSGMEDSVVINGTALSVVRYLAPGVGSAQPSGAISGAEFEQVQIIDGKALLDVSVYTSDTLTNQNWSVATNGVIEVPAPGKQGFFYLMSKPAAPSNLDLPPIVTVK